MTSGGSGGGSDSAGPPRGDEDPAPGSDRPGPWASASHAARTFSRIRTLRAAIVALGVLVLGALGWAIWTRRPPKTATESPPASSAASPAGTLQTLERFQFTSTRSGKRDYAISADRMRAIEGGVRTLEGIRSVEFPRPDGSVLEGSAERGTFTETGASEDAGGVLVLEGNVRLRGPEGERIESDRIEYAQTSGTIVSPGRTRLGFRDGAAEAGRLTYDLRARSAAIDGGVSLHFGTEGNGPETHMTAKRGSILGGGDSADLEGGVTVVRGADSLTGPSLHLERAKQGARTLRFSMGSPASGRIDPSAVDGAPAAGGGSSPLVIAASRIEGSEEGSSGAREIVLVGAASVMDATAPGGSAPRRIDADRIAIAEDTGQGRVMVAEGSVRAVFIEVPRAAAREDQAAATKKLHASLPAGSSGAPAAPASSTAGVRRLSSRTLRARFGPGGAIESAEAEGGVRFEGAEGTATAERARLIGEKKAELRGGRPVLAERERTLTADEIDLDMEAQQVAGRGSVRSRFLPRGSDASGLFVAGQPIEISSQSALLRKAERRGDYAGKVLARQGERALGADTLALDDAARTVNAEGHVQLRTFRQEGGEGRGEAAGAGSLSPEPSPGAGRERAPAADAGAPGTSRPSVRVPVQVSSGRLDYDGRSDVARFEGQARYTEPGRTLSAERIVLDGAGGGSRWTVVTADGGVILVGEGRRAASDSARYQATDRTVVLRGVDRPATIVEIATGRAWRGPSLTWVLTADSIPTVSGDSGRSSVVGAAAAPGGARIGEQALGGKPR